MPTNVGMQIPFLPQASQSEAILSAIALAHEHAFRRQQLAQQQQQLQLAQQKAPAEIEEAKARAGFYGTEAQKNQLQVDQIRRAQQMFSGGGAQPGVTPAQPVQPGQGTTAQPAHPSQPSAASAQWLPQGTPPNLAPVVSQMIPANLTDEEKPIIESAAAAGNPLFTGGDLQGYFKALQGGITDVANRRLQLRNQPENQPATDADKKQFNESILPSLENLSDAQKKLAISAMAGAKSQRDVRDVRDQFIRLDAQSLEKTIAQQNIIANKQLALQQEEAKQGLSDTIKIWTDPQHRFSQTRAQAVVGKAAIQAGVDGNGLLTSLEPTMAVLGMNSFALTHRISPAEAQAAGAPGGWSERFTAWATKAAEGKLSDQLAKEGTQLFDLLIKGKYDQSVQSTRMIVANTPGMDEKKVTIISPDGDMQKLSDVPKTAKQPSVTSQAPPPGATMKVPGSDGKMHWSNGKQDLGVVQ